MTVTNLALWTLGPAHFQGNQDDLACVSCTAPVTEDQFCEGCGQALCAKCRILVQHEPHCAKCAADVRKGRC